MTLLKNDGTLPLSGVKKISVLGKSSVNPQYAGSGSGASGGTVISLLDALTEVGYTVNPVVEDFYNNNTRSGVGPKVASFFGGGGEITIGETPKASYDDSVIDSFSHYHDAAIVLLKRSGSEGSDNPRRCGDFATDSDAVKNAHHYFQLSENEKDLIAMAEANFDKVVVVLNTPSPIEVQTLKNDAKINGVIWAGLPGGTGFRALAGILNGDVNPSGHTVDTWAADYRKDPTWNNFGDGSQTSSDMTTANYTLQRRRRRCSGNRCEGLWPFGHR
jgi:beta-glucosidase